jgi:hypothetical protein
MGNVHVVARRPLLALCYKPSPSQVARFSPSLGGIKGKSRCSLTLVVCLEASLDDPRECESCSGPVFTFLATAVTNETSTRTNETTRPWEVTRMTRYPNSASAIGQPRDSLPCDSLMEEV